MSENCCLVQELLPLYLEGEVGEPAREQIEAHLKNCPECAARCETLRQPESVDFAAAVAVPECQKAASFAAVKKKMRRKLVVSIEIAIFALILTVSAVKIALKSNLSVVDEAENLVVIEINGALIGQLYGSSYASASIQRVEVFQKGEKQTCLFFAVYDTKWDRLTTAGTVCSQLVLCAADKGAAEIDRVYYYPGDLTGIESLPPDELEQLAADAALLWSRR